LPTSRSPVEATPRRSALEGVGERFGDRTVGPEERRRRIRAIFAAIAPGYDLANDLMSLGLHRRWKARLAGGVRPDGAVLDLAGGTGDVTRLLRKRGLDVLNGDPSAAMLRVARRRGVGPVVGLAAEALPLRDASLGAVTLAFGLRNFTAPQAALGEIRRVLRPGGRLHLLEFSRPDAWLRPFYTALSGWLLPLLGGLVTGRPGAYRYLARSIAGFPDAVAVSDALRAAGFRVVAVEPLAFGIACLHVAERPVEAG
jgi:demethylmenaquinone methyltransferase/2-methoxy-6-polyprenyl-1,4-benzoquinol methylase